MIKLSRKITLICFTFRLRKMKKRKINCSNGSSKDTWVMMLKIPIHKLPHILENEVLMFKGCYSNKFMVRVAIKTQKFHFSGQSIPILSLLPLILDIIDLVLLLFFVLVMMLQEEREPTIEMMIMLEMEGIFNNNTKENIH